MHPSCEPVDQLTDHRRRCPILAIKKISGYDIRTSGGRCRGQGKESLLLSNDVAVCGDLNLWASLPEAFAIAANQPRLGDLSAVWMHSIG